jgi:U3 small nucleolar ribonucleoprotein protein IMP4
VRRIGRDLAFATGGRYVTRGKGGLSRPPFSDGTVIVLCRDGKGIRMLIIDGMQEGPSLRFTSVKEEPRAGPLRRGLFTGSPDVLASLESRLTVNGEADLGDSLVFDGVQGRRIVLGV